MSSSVSVFLTDLAYLWLKLWCNLISVAARMTLLIYWGANWFHGAEHFFSSKWLLS